MTSSYQPQPPSEPNQEDSNSSSHNHDTNTSLSAFDIHEEALYQQVHHARQSQRSAQLALEDAMTTSTTTSSTTDHAVAFRNLWDSELHRMESLLEAQQQNLLLSAKALLVNVEAALQQQQPFFLEPSSSKAADNNTTVVQEWRHKTDTLVAAGRHLHRFMRSNRDTLTNIATYADDQLGGDAWPTLQTRFQAAPWKMPSTWIVVLSDIYQVLRSVAEQPPQPQQEQPQPQEQWVAPSLFERTTTKYWVEDDQVTELLLAAVSEAPLLVYGKSGRLTPHADCLTSSTTTTTSKPPIDRLWEELAIPITSVYLDSPSLSLYGERLPRREGAQLLRIRWYGRKPVDTEIVFLELKTHHEKWVCTKSLKERVAIRDCDVEHFLKTDEPWTLEEAQRVAALATAATDTAQTSLQRDADRLFRMKQLVVKHALRPCVRTCYLRAAFQSSNSNALRLTIDRNITMMDEGKHAAAAASSVADNNYTNSSSSWCLPENAVMEQSMAARRVPFVVLEVKLAGDDSLPPIMLDLQERGVIIEATKFSKFLTGAATFNLNRVGMLPYWAEHPAFATVFGMGNNNNNNNNNSDKTDTEMASTPLSRESDSTNHSVTFKSDNTSEISGFSGDNNKEGTHSVLDANRLEGETAKAPRRRLRASGFMSILSSSTTSLKAGDDSAEFINKSRVNNNKTSNSSGGGLGAFFRRRRRGRDASQAETVKVAPKRPARVEPKSYFANERTFIQWISAALLLVTISVILLGIDSNMGSTSAYARKSGIGVCCGAVVIVFYATYVYFRRLHLLSTGNAYGYIDHVGPFILAVSVCVGVCVLLIHFLGEIEFARQLENRKVYLHEQPGQCYLHSNRGISKLEYQPSDIVVDSSRNMLLVPSLQRIVSHSLEAPLPNRENRVKTLIEIPDSNIEGLTVVDDRVFALSEGPKKTELIELTWSGDDELSLSVAHRWKLSKTEEAEALTYVPDKTRRSGRLFVDVNKQVHIYEVPEPPTLAGTITETKDDDDDALLVEEETFEDVELERIGSLNNHVLTTGLKEHKISSMFYFEGIAYILHDNEMLLRAWDLDEGDLLAEIPLPRVEGGFSKEWEGVALERREMPEGEGALLTERNYSLRGSTEPTKTQLIMHLALDTPAQVWSMAVKEGSTRGSLILPSCAVNAHVKADSISEDESSDSLDHANTR